MAQVRVHNFSVSLDGFGTWEGQSFDAPFGHATGRLMEWLFATRTFHTMHDKAGGDEAFASNWGLGIGAEIMGRNKFGPQRGPWEDDEWKGWWGDNPVFHTPVFVLTHYARPSIELDGGTNVPLHRRESCRSPRCRARGRRCTGRPHRWGPIDYPRVPDCGPDRSHAHRLGAHRAWARGTAVDWAGNKFGGILSLYGCAACLREQSYEDTVQILPPRTALHARSWAKMVSKECGADPSPSDGKLELPSSSWLIPIATLALSIAVITLALA